MRCRQFQDLIDAHIDGETDESTNLGMIRHMETCMACRTLHNQRNYLYQTLKTGCAATMEIDVADEVMERINKLPHPDKLMSTKYRIFFVFLPILLATGSIIFWIFPDITNFISRVGLLKWVPDLLDLSAENLVIPHETWVFLNAFRMMMQTVTQIIVQIAGMLLEYLPTNAPINFLCVGGVFVAVLWRRSYVKQSSSLWLII